MDREDRMFVAGISYKTTSQEARKALHLSVDQTAECLKKLRDHPLVQEAIIISTCNRLELCGVLVDGVDLRAHAEKFFFLLQQWSAKDPAAAAEAVQNKLTIKRGCDAYRQVILLTSGLSSMIVGETQITAQWKQAFNQAKGVGAVGPYLNKLHQTALSSAKKVRSQTVVGRGTVSLGHAAVNILEKQHGGLGGLRVAVVGGGGRVGGLAARYLASKRPLELYVVNRTIKKASVLVAELGFGVARELRQLPDLLGSVDAIITATSSDEPIITLPMVERFKSRTRPLELIDLSLSGDVDPMVSEVDDVFLYPIDAIGQIINSNISRRAEATSDARPIVQAGVNQMEAWVAARSSAVMLSRCSGVLGGILEAELARSKLTERHGVSPEAIESLKAAVVRKFIVAIKHKR